MAYLATIAPGTAVAAETIEEFDTPNDGIEALEVLINVTAITGSATPTLQPYLETLGEDGVWYVLWKPTAITATGQIVDSVGAGQSSPAVLGPQSRLRLEVTGTTPSFTISASIIGR